MKLMLYTLDNCMETSLEDTICVLEICNKRYYSRILRSFSGEIFDPKEVALIEKEKALNLDKDCILLFNIIDINVTEKTIVGKLHKKIIEDNLLFDKGLAFEKITLDIIVNIENLIADMDLDLTFISELDVKEYLQLVKLSPAKALTPIERLLDYIALIGELNLCKLLVLVNSKSLFDDEEMEKIYRYALYKNVKLCIIENIRQENKLKYETKIFIDEDGFDIKI